MVRVKNPRVARLMLPFLEDEEVASQVVEAIGRLGSGAVNATIEALDQMKGKESNIPVMENIIKILGELKDPRAVESLESLSQHSSERIRDAVDRALFQIRGYLKIRPSELTLGFQNPQVRSFGQKTETIQYLLGAFFLSCFLNPL